MSDASPATENVVAFTRLFGDLRFFHPSDEAADADWEALAITAIPRVERARGPDELASALNAIFSPVAPTVRIYPTGRPAPPPRAIAEPPDGPAPTYVGWVHQGVKLDEPRPIWGKVRASNRYTPRPTPSELHTWITGASLRGKTLRVHASVRAELSSPGASAVVALEAWVPAIGIRDVAAATVGSAEWHDVELVGPIPDAERMQVHFGLRVTGDGKAWVDDVTASADGVAVPLDDPDFERATPGLLPAGWFNENGTARASASRPHAGRLSGEIDAEKLPLEPLPVPARTRHVVLGAGVEADVPLTLYVDATGHTLPRSATPPSLLASATGRAERLARYSADDRAVRLADVALTWTVFQHFYPYFDVVEVDWEGELRRAIRSARIDRDTASFHATLKRMIAALHDGHDAVSVDEARIPARAGMPLGLRVVEGELVVTALASGSGEVKIGDVIESLDGVSATDALAREGTMVSSPTPQWLALREAKLVDFGPGDEWVTLALKHPDGTRSTARVRRTEASDVGTTRVAPEKIAEVRPGILYVDLDRITDEDFASAMPRLATASGIVFDLRGYPRAVSVDPLRHLARETLRCPQFFNLKTLRPDREGVVLLEARCALMPLEPRLEMPVVFLTDARAMSKAESYMGIVEAYKLGTIVGDTTGGTNGDLNSFLLPGGFQVRFTGTKTLKNDGTRHHGVGIAPNVRCAPTIAGIARGVDEVLECGIRVVGTSAR